VTATDAQAVVDFLLAMSNSDPKLGEMNKISGKNKEFCSNSNLGFCGVSQPGISSAKLHLKNYH